MSRHTSRIQRLEHVEEVARDHRIRAGMILIGARLAAGDQAMAEALDRLAETSTREAGLIALEQVLALLDPGERDPAVLERLQQMVEDVSRLSDDELLGLLARRGRR